MDGVIAEIRGFAGNFAPKGWAFCQGQLLSISQNTALFSLIGTIYGGDGRTTFALPDLRGRVPISSGTGPGLSSRKEGARGGEEVVTLNALQMPSHIHTAAATITGATIGGSATAEMNINNTAFDAGSEGNGAYLGFSDAGELYATSTDGSKLKNDAISVNTSGLTVDVSGASVTVNPTGGSQYHNNMQPYLVINWIICLVGLFPSRN